MKYEYSIQCIKIKNRQSMLNNKKWYKMLMSYPDRYHCNQFREPIKHHQLLHQIINNITSKDDLANKNLYHHYKKGRKFNIHLI